MYLWYDFSMCAARHTQPCKKFNCWLLFIAFLLLVFSRVLDHREESCLSDFWCPCLLSHSRLRMRAKRETMKKPSH
jgi:hypothetical protein